MSQPALRHAIAPDRADAVVVGACAHGLAISRSLWRAGLSVAVIEADRSLPGTHTRAARVFPVPGIHGQELLDSLRTTVKPLGNDRPLPVFLTNDRMVTTIATHAAQVAESCRVSWLSAAPAIVALLSKSSLQSRCRATGLEYPRTVILADAQSDSSLVLDSLRFPVILKPDRPLSGFKTKIVDARDQFAAALRSVREHFPIVVQELVPGDDTNIRFGALYLHEGVVIARFEGRKLRSRPLGHTTIAVSAADDAVFKLTQQFFAGLGISGPVSLEFMRDADGRHWVIEPTVGRTDFWVDLCIANGVDLPLIEYSMVAGAGLPTSTQSDRSLWINGERDPGALLWLLGNHPVELLRRRPRGVYFSMEDPVPYLAASSSRLFRLPGRAWRRLSRTGW